MDKLPIIILWIQNVPDTNESVLSRNGEPFQPGSSEYINNFKCVTELNLDDSRSLTPTVKRYTRQKHNLRATFLSGHFIQKDEHGRLICYRAVIKNASNEEAELDLLKKEAAKYGCSISEEDQCALKKKDVFFG